MTLEGRPTATITGGLGDIGSEIAVSLGKSGWDLLLLDIMQLEQGEHKSNEISAACGANVRYMQVDQCDEVTMRHALNTVENLALMVITAATVKAAPFLEVTAKDWRRQIEINLNGSFVAAQVAAQNMIESKVHGQVIFTSSWVADRPWPEISAYSSSKAGVNQLMRQMALELAPMGIRANAIAPGIVRAGLAKSQLDSEPQYAARVAQAVPLGNLQEASAIGDAVAYMASPAASSMTGTVLLIDGGCSLGQIR